MSSVSAAQSIDDNAFVIKVHGRFEPAIGDAFQEVYADAPPKSRFVVDFADTEAFDSASLSLLLGLRNYAGGQNADVALVNCPEDGKQLLELMNFDQLFRIP